MPRPQRREDYLGPDHPQTGQTHCDVAQALEALLARAADALFAAFSKLAGSREVAQDLLQKSQREHQRIEVLYRRRRRHLR